VLKKLSLIAIIAILAYSQVGYYFVMRYTQMLHKKEIKKQIRSQLSNAELEIISLTDNHQNIHWVKEEKEFIFNGEMYDVVRRETTGGKEIMYCINDKKEKALVDHYNLITKNNSSSDKKEKHTFQNSINLFIYEDEIIRCYYFTFLVNDFHSYDSRLPENLQDEISPPPKA
jgi:hypothetical protein